MTEKLIAALVSYDGRDTRRIGHACKVYALAKTLGELAGLSAADRAVLEAAAVLHDVGIHACEQKYHSTAGNYQQLEGPPIARRMLEQTGATAAQTERILWLIAHHHTYGLPDAGTDYQCLIEADFLVNMDEDQMSPGQIQSIGEKYFRTEPGRRFLREMFPTEPVA